MEESKKWVKTNDVENCMRQVDSKGKKGCRKPNVSHYTKRNCILPKYFELKASHI